MISKYVRRSRRCLLCNGAKLTRILSLGNLPLANSYLTQNEITQPEVKIPLDVYFCQQCHLVQLLDIVDRSRLFRHYAYFSSASSTLVTHFAKYAQDLLEKFPKLTQKLVIDIGCNDGVLLKPLKKGGARVLGIDPAKNITPLLIQENIAVITDFFSQRIVPQILKQFGQAGIITANNVLAHTDKIHDILAATKRILSPEGVFVFEVQYVAALLQKNQFDSIYHEHICYFSLKPLIYLLEKHGLRIFDFLFIDNHGGSLRIYACHTDGPFRTRNSIVKLKKQETDHQLHEVETYKKFARQLPRIITSLAKLITAIKKQGKSIVGYGAPAKATTLLNYCNINNKIIDYITDTTPVKQDLYLPGVHIPIMTPDVLKKRPPDFLLILAWNYTEAILKKERWFSRRGGKFIIPLPYPEII